MVDGSWDWDSCKRLEPGDRKDIPVGAMSNVRGAVWVALDRKVYELDVTNFKVAVRFSAVVSCLSSKVAFSVV